jgi:2'-5' RNA ligase
MASVRTFIAVELADTVRRRAAQLAERLAQANTKVKWVAPENMHLTLKFLGDVPVEKTAAVCQAVAEAVREIPAFAAESAGAGAFPSPGRPSTIWLGIGEGTEQLIRLHTAVDRALRPLGFPREGRKYSPHLTIGRVRGGGRGTRELADLLRQNADFEAGPSHISQVITFSSDLTPKGPVYTALGRAPLADSGDS